MAEMSDEEVDEDEEESVEEAEVTGGAVEVEWTVTVEAEETDDGGVDVEEGVEDGVEEGVVVVLVLDGGVVVELDDEGVVEDELGRVVGGMELELLDDGAVVEEAGSVDEALVGAELADVGAREELLVVLDDMMMRIG